MKYYHFPLSLLVSGLLLTACVDKDYDLNDIDLTLGSDVDLAMPLISTNQIKLIDFVKGDFLDTTPIPGQDGEVLYASAESNKDLVITIPAIADGSVEFTDNKPSITIPKLPDFLKGEDVRLDLYNPILITNVSSEDLPEGWTIKAEILVETDGGQSMIVKGISASGEKKLCQYVSAEEDYIPEHMLDEDYGEPIHIKPASGSIRELLSPSIPKWLRLSVNKVEAHGPGFVVPHPVIITLGAKLYAPMQIGGNDFTLSYEAIEDGWSDEFSDKIRKMDISQVELTADMTNSLPVDAHVTLTPIDDEGDEIDGLDVITVKADAATESPATTSPVRYVLRSRKPGLTMRDFISGTNGAQQLDGMRINARLKATEDSEGKYITDKAYATFTNLKLHAKGQFIYDAN